MILSQEIFSCPNIDLRNPGHAMENIPITQQKGIGNCYAHASATTFDGLLKLDDPTSTHQTSILETSFLEKSKGHFIASKFEVNPFFMDSPEHLNSGDTCRTFNQLSDKGGCPSRYLEKRVFQLQTPKNQGETKEFMDYIIGLYKYENRDFIEFIQGQTQEIVDQQEKIIEREIKNISEQRDKIESQIEKLDDQLDTLFELDYHDFQKIDHIKSLTLELQSKSDELTKDELRKHHQLIEEFDEERRSNFKDIYDFQRAQKFKMGCQHFGILDQNEWLYSIHDILTQSISAFQVLAKIIKRECKYRRVKLPYKYTCHKIKNLTNTQKEMAINSNFSFGQNSLPLPLGINASVIAKGHNGPHAVVAIGSRLNGEQCQYLIRSSWGKLCISPLEDGVECDRGDYWVNKDNLLKKTHSIFKIIKK